MSISDAITEKNMKDYVKKMKNREAEKEVKSESEVKKMDIKSNCPESSSPILPIIQS
jgi:hypothetical protein